MAHNVETMAYAGQVPWHGLGKKVPPDLTSVNSSIVLAALPNSSVPPEEGIFKNSPALPLAVGNVIFVPPEPVVIAPVSVEVPATVTAPEILTNPALSILNLSVGVVLSLPAFV